MGIFDSYIPGQVSKKVEVQEEVKVENKIVKTKEYKKIEEDTSDEILRSVINKLKGDNKAIVKANEKTVFHNEYIDIKPTPEPPASNTPNKVFENIRSTLSKKIEDQQTPTSNPVFDSLRKKETPKPVIVTPTGVEYEDYSNYKITFMSQFPRFELLHKDHSGIIVGKKCLRKYFYKNVICMVPIEDNNIFYPWGSSYHIFREKLSEYYGYGDNEPKTFDESKAKEAYQKAAREGIEYWIMNGEDQKPDSKYDWFTTERLRKSFRVAYEHWVLERKRGIIKIVAIEQFFTVQLIDGRFVQGRIDELTEVNDDLWNRDFKSTMKPEEWFLKSMIPNNQVRTYTFGSEKLSGRKVRGTIIQAMYNAKSTKKEDKGPLVYEKLIECSDYEIEQWEKEQVLWNDILEQCRETDTWPQTEDNCQYCEYQGVCTKQSEAAMVYQIENKYTRKLRNPARLDDE